MLKRRVFVKGINNLSDARYCAGMGVEFLCFELDPSHKDYLEPKAISEIKNWLVGVNIGLRLTDLKEIDLSLLDDIQPDFLVISESQEKVFIQNELLFIETDSSMTFDKHYNWLKLEKLANNQTFAANCFIEKDWTIEEIEDLNDRNSEFGLILSGGKEERPGFSDYGQLMDILEALDD